MNESKRMQQLAGLNEAMSRITQSGDHDDILFVDFDLSATDFATIKKKFKAAAELGLEIDIRSGYNDAWADKRGDLIFQSNWLLKLVGKKYYASVDDPSKPELVKPDSSTEIYLQYFKRKNR